jgi:O-methyltransferase
MLRSSHRLLYNAFVRNRFGGLVLRLLVRANGTAEVIHDFIEGEADYGSAYGMRARDRRTLIAQFQRSNRAIPSATSVVIHTVLAKEILSISPALTGSVIECGVWKGASTASLSLVCGIVGRRLLVCDSFDGLPDDGMKPHFMHHAGICGYYKQGMFRGTLDEVRENLRAYGDLQVCDFLPGFFSESLQTLSTPLVFAFIDVDLISSTKDCLRYIWPLLAADGRIYTDDAGDLDVVRVFFDESWWQENLHCPSPGYIGSGCGLPLAPGISALGYTRKISSGSSATWKRAPYLYYPDQSSAPR